MTPAPAPRPRAPRTRANAANVLSARGSKADLLPTLYDTAVVGGSWAGLSAAVQLARARRRVLVVDAGRPRDRLAHASHGILGQDGRAPATVREVARAELLAYPTAEFRSDEVVRARPCEGTADGPPAAAAPPTYELTFSSGARVRARRVVLATGIVDELPPVPGLAERWGRSVFHCPYCYGYEVADGRLGVLGVGEASVHQALVIPDWSADVTLFTGGAAGLTPAQRAALAARGVKVETRRVAALVGDAPALKGVRLAGGAVVGLDALFLVSRTRLAGPRSADSLAEQLGCAVDEGPLGPMVRTNARKETTAPGVYAAGDAARAPHTASWASADGVIAGLSAHQSLALG